MKRIVIMSRRDSRLAEMLKELFPECEISMVAKEEGREEKKVGERPPNRQSPLRHLQLVAQRQFP